MVSRRTIFFWVAAAASFGGPYTAYNPEVRETISNYWNSATQVSPPGEQVADASGAPAASIPGTQAAGQPGTAMPGQSGLNALSIGPPRTAPVFQDFTHVFNFNANPRWIIETWPRVSTTLADMRLEGLRVPLVTGSRVDDLAGSLTYYFDQEKQLQRITFQGTTGDERRLVAMLQQVYEFELEPSVAGTMYMVKWNGEPVSVLRVEPAPVINANLPHTRLNLHLEINRPSRYYALSPEVKQLVERDKHAGRWGFK